MVTKCRQTNSITKSIQIEYLFCDKLLNKFFFLGYESAKVCQYFSGVFIPLTPSHQRHIAAETKINSRKDSYQQQHQYCFTNCICFPISHRLSKHTDISLDVWECLCRSVCVCVCGVCVRVCMQPKYMHLLLYILIRCFRLSFVRQTKQEARERI